MLDQKRTTTRSELREDGWHVITEDVAPTATGNAPYPPAAPPVAAVISVTMAQEVLKQHGFVAIPLEEIEALPAKHRDKLLKVSESAPEELDEAATIEKVQQAETMEELEKIMDGITAAAVIAAAEEKAAELTAEA